MPRRLLRRDGRASLRARLAAWWEGAPAPRTETGPEAASGPSTTAAAAGTGRPALTELWPRERIEAATLLWGAGFVTPFGAEATIELAGPLDLQPGDTLLDAAGRLGGAALALADRHHLRVAALEPSPALAAAGAALTRAQGAGGAVTLAAYDPHAGEIKRGPYAAALAHELLFTLDNKEALLRRIVRALAPEGRILIGDYVVAGPGDGPALAGWQAVDPGPVRPWRLDDARKCLARLQVDVTAATDETARLRALINGGLDAFAKGAAARPVAPTLARPLAREIAIWAARKQALDAGEIRFVSLVGVKTGEPA